MDLTRGALTGKPTGLTIRHIPSSELAPEVAASIHRLCDLAYGCPTRPLFDSLGSGDHLVATRGAVLVSHLMWVTRWLQPEGQLPVRTAYVEMVATHPSEQRQGCATSLLEAAVPCFADYELAALCPATEGLYQRLGWRFWRGPLFARTAGRRIPTPDERVMILPLAKTPRLDLDLPLSVEWRPGEVW